MTVRWQVGTAGGQPAVQFTLGWTGLADSWIAFGIGGTTMTNKDCAVTDTDAKEVWDCKTASSKSTPGYIKDATQNVNFVSGDAGKGEVVFHRLAAAADPEDTAIDLAGNTGDMIWAYGKNKLGTQASYHTRRGSCAAVTWCGAAAGSPTIAPSQLPSGYPSGVPSLSPSASPSSPPASSPSSSPSVSPSTYISLTLNLALCLTLNLALCLAFYCTICLTHCVLHRSPRQYSQRDSARHRYGPRAASVSRCTLSSGASTGRCTAGQCADRCAGVQCPASDSCHRPGSCNPDTGLCSDPAAPEGAPCDDGDASTAADSCRAGVCRGTAKCAGVECAVCDARCAKAQCAPNTGKCVEQEEADGKPCNDGDPGTKDDKCAAGLCIGTADLCAGTLCTRASQCHVAGACDSATGRCSEPPAENGTVCNDGDPATVNDSCSGGICVGTLPCGNATCEASRGGLLDPRCHIPSCSSDRGSCAIPTRRPDGAPCADGRPETTAEKCAQGQCVGAIDRCSGVQCLPPSQCHGLGRCDAESGLCVDQTLPDGKECDDGDPGTKEDKCASGVCAGRLDCPRSANGICQSPPSACHRTACGTSGCEVRLRDCAPCSDGDPGTVGDMCRGGACVGVFSNGSQPSPAAGTIAIHDATSVSYSAAAISGGQTVEVTFTVMNDKFADLGPNATLRCGLSSDPTAAVVLSGTRSQVADACTVSVLPPASILIRISPSPALVPKRRETVHVSVRPGVMQSGVSPIGYANFELLPEEQPVAAIVSGAPPIAPGVGSLALKLRQCTDDQEPEEDLGRVMSPTGLKVGDEEMAAYNGALLANAVFLVVVTLACSGLYAYLTVAGAARVRQSGGGVHLSRRRRLAAARVGVFVYFLTFLYPSSSFTAASVLLYGKGLYRALAGVMIVMCGLLPLFVFRVVRNAPTFATVVESTDPQSCWARLFLGTKGWEPIGASYGHQVYQLFYDSYSFRDKHVLVFDLVLNAALAVLQSVRPRTELQCRIIGATVLCLMTGFALYVTIRRSHITPYDTGCTAVVLWGEILSKSLLVTVGYGHRTDHWAVVTANVIATIVSAALAALALIGLSLFFASQYSHWAAVPGGGKEVTGLRRRLARFAAYWFVFIGIVDAMMGDDGVVASQRATVCHEQLASQQDWQDSPGPSQYSLLALDGAAGPSPLGPSAGTSSPLGPRRVPAAAAAAPLDVGFETAKDAEAAGVTLEGLRVPDAMLPPAERPCGSALRAARDRVCQLRAGASFSQVCAAQSALFDAAAAVSAERRSAAAIAGQLAAADMLLHALGAALRSQGAPAQPGNTPAPLSPGGAATSPTPAAACRTAGPLSPLSAAAGSAALPRPRQVTAVPAAPPSTGQPLSPLSPGGEPPPRVQPSATPLLPAAARSGLHPLRRSAPVQFPRAALPPL
eukprot:TRINITY_DN8978_c0_g1_i1.p1 TRINITY_DN8978_c0_g1~~TRINITY_DN8978_c0_g1_i1.p1  ORF type:complete len:1528 (+),score=269.75 TRINITY_DN8978_c0_g1_i1:340-4584(+)